MLWQGLAIVLVGVAIGEVLTAALTRCRGLDAGGHWSERICRRTSPIGLIWIAVALVACYVPAARAARVDPLVALRHE